MDNKPVPDKLSGLYNTLLSRRASNEHKDWELTITALKLLAVTHRPFSILELSWAVTLHTARHVTTVDDLSKLVDHQKLMSLIQPFIACVEPSNLRRYQVQLIYQSMKELILRRWEPNATYSGSPASGRDDGQRFGGPEALILDICIRYLLLTEIDDQYLFSEEQIAISELPQESDLFNDEKEPVKYDSHCSWEAWEEDMIQFNPAELGLGEFFVYASCYWLKYYSPATAEALPNLASIERLCRANSIRIRNWIQQNRRPGCTMPPRFPFDSQLYDPLGITCLYGSVDMLHVMLRGSDLDNNNFLNMTAVNAADQILQWGDMARLGTLFLDSRLGHQLRNLDFFRLIIRRWRESSVSRPDWDDAFALIDLATDQMVQQQWGLELLCVAASAGCAPVAQRLLSGARHNDGLRRELLRRFPLMPQVAPLK
ncbi:hypothetical protein AnigIFM60653_011450 [Aspergillus niger]|nr:hypothetical protein AnigIFM60653_011450 [Aspergillus niger]GLA14571.1 hypothetical protein AnigIFM62618_001007 [Aspergillus niger]